MAFAKQATLPGFNRTFEVSPEARPYTLRDNGFVNTKPGNFKYERHLDSNSKQGLVLKVSVNKDLTQLQINTTSANGLKSIDVTKLDDNAMVVEKINFIFDGFVDRHCLVEVK